MRAEAEAPPLRALIDACEATAQTLLDAADDDRLAGSSPFLTMLSVAVCGWLMERGARVAAAAGGDPAFTALKQAAARFYVRQVVPEAMGLRSEEHTSELQSLMRISYAVFCFNKKTP